jgi:hypothetical protein
MRGETGMTMLVPILAGVTIGLLVFQFSRLNRRVDENDERLLELAKRVRDLMQYVKLSQERLDAHAEWIRFTDKALRLNGPVEKEPARG